MIQINNPTPKRFHPMDTSTERKPLGFGKTMLASATGFLIAFVVIRIIGFFLIIGLFVALAVGTTQETPSMVTGNHIFLKVDLSRNIAERNPDKMSSLLRNSKTQGLCDILKAIEHAKSDSRVEGIYLYCNDASIAWAQCDELRDALEDYRSATGNPIVAYADNYSQTGYYLASTSDCMGLHPSGIVDLRGIGAEVIFYKDLLDKLGVRMELIRPVSNAYKSAGETYTRSNMSEANREQIRSYVNSIWQHVVANLAESRQISTDNINMMADNLTGYVADNACKNRLVDTLLFERDMRQLMKEQYGCRRLVDITKYAHSFTETNTEDHIAIIYAEGNVVDGTSEGYNSAVYSDDIVEALHTAAKDEDVKAIVLRINSPGGSATASEAMTHAVIEANKKKPVIVSMSALAASAGYEIASNATTIVAQPTTLTGSIGVFAAIPEVGGLLKKKLGIGVDTVNTNKNSTGLSLTRPLSPTARATMQHHVEEFYKTFLQRVADGRNMTTDAVDQIARGRVWTGAQAIENGLVDTLGGLSLALRIAAEQAGIDEYSTVDYPREKDFLTRLLDVANEKEDILLNDRLESVVPYYHELLQWSNMAPLQARIPYIIQIEN